MPGPRARPARTKLLNLLTAEFDEPQQASGLIDEFLRNERYNSDFCLRLIAVAKQGAGASWGIRRLAILMLEHQILKVPPHNLDDFDFLFTQLSLKEAPGLSRAIVVSVLREGYSTTDLRQFIPEFRRKLARLNRVHDKVRWRRTATTALRDLIELSRHDCKLSLARYLFTPDEIVTEIRRHLRVTDGAKDLDTSQPAFVDDEIRRAKALLPEFEARILQRLCDTSKIYWVSDTTSSELNSLVEYPTTTVVLVIKPPGSDIEFEIKRAGRKGHHPLNVVYARNGYTVPQSHRLDGGNMQWLLRYEARAASQLSAIYRLVHGTEAPIPHYISRATIYGVPARDAEVQTLTYFTQPRAFADGFREMRVAMAESVAAFRSEGYANLPALPGDLGLTAQFVGIVAPAQAILSGTSSFRLDKLATYLSDNGPQRYVEDGGGTVLSRHDARRLADTLLEELLGVYRPPDVRYRTYGQYLVAAFAVAANRARADRVYLSLVQQISRFWGTFLAIRGYSRGESFVARNVGLKSVWDAGQWQVRIIFMDHDAVVIPGPRDRHFDARGALQGMKLDESYICGGSWPAQFPTSEVGYLQTIYKVSDGIKAKGHALGQRALTDAYKESQYQLVMNKKLRPFFDDVFVERLRDWDMAVEGYLRITPGTDASARWKEETRKRLAAKGYDGHVCDAYIGVIEDNRAFLERNRCLFGVGSGKMASPREASAQFTQDKPRHPRAMRPTPVALTRRKSG